MLISIGEEKHCIRLKVLEVMFSLEEYPQLNMFEKARIVYSNAFAIIWKSMGNIY